MDLPRECVTPANCQMTGAIGQDAIVAQPVNPDLFGESLKTHTLLGQPVPQWDECERGMLRT